MTGTVTSLWQIAGGYSYQDGFVTSATTAARGAQVGQLPHHTFFSVEQLQISSARLGGTGLDWPIGHVYNDR